MDVHHLCSSIKLYSQTLLVYFLCIVYNHAIQNAVSVPHHKKGTALVQSVK